MSLSESKTPGSNHQKRKRQQLTRYLQGWIYGVTPLDAMTFVGAAALMLLVAACAICVPLQRALNVDPVVALRAE